MQEPQQVTSDLPPFARVPRWLVERSDVSHLGVRLFAMLTRYEGLPHGIIPSLATLASQLGVDRSTVKRAARELRDFGAITVEVRRDDRGQTSNRYVLHYRDPGASATPGASVHPPRGQGCTPPGGRGDPRTETNESRDQREPRTDEVSVPATSVAAAGWEEARGLCEFLADAIVESGGPGTKRPTVTRKWVQTMEHLVRIDGREPDHVRNAVDWCHRGAGTWWADKVLSPESLRRHYEKMRRQAVRDRPTGQSLAQGYEAAAAAMEGNR